VVQRNFTLARASDIMFAVVQRAARRDATMAAVTHRDGRWPPSEIAGIITERPPTKVAALRA
jgi:hypothetical protein